MTGAPAAPGATASTGAPIYATARLPARRATDPVRRLIPEPSTPIDPWQAYDDQAADWLRLGMVTSLDGSATDEHGRSGGLGGEPDHRIFHTLRGLCDAILVGAGTIRTEGYGPHRPSGDLRERRIASGRTPAAPIVVVTRSLRLDWSSPLFTQAAAPTVVVTCAAATTRRSPPASVPLVVAGDTSVDLDDALRQLRAAHGLRQLLCEGGPRLAAGLLAAGLVDEMCLTLAPSLVGAGHRAPLLRHLAHRVDLTLTALHEDDGVLLARYAP